MHFCGGRADGFEGYFNIAVECRDNLFHTLRPFFCLLGGGFAQLSFFLYRFLLGGNAFLLIFLGFTLEGALFFFQLKGF